MKLIEVIFNCSPRVIDKTKSNLSSSIFFCLIPTLAKEYPIDEYKFLFFRHLLLNKIL